MTEHSSTAPEIELSAGQESETEHKDAFTVEKQVSVRSLTLKEASQILGKSMRALERSLTGKWGNRLPDGWSARLEIIDGREEWRVIPPAEFETERSNIESMYTEPSFLNRALKGDFIGSLIQAATGLGSTSVWEKDSHQLMQPSSADVVQLLKELTLAHKSLAEEQKAHLEDLKLLSELQSSMKLLRVNEEERAVIKEELLAAQRDLIDLKNKYQSMIALPWWKRIFLK